MRRRRETKADLERRVCELLLENEKLLYLFEMTARRLEAYKQKDMESYANDKKNGTGIFRPLDRMSFTEANKEKTL